MNEYITKQVDDRIVEIAEKYADGIRNKTVIDILREEFPSANPNTINTRVASIQYNRPESVEKLNRGVITHVSHSGSVEDENRNGNSDSTRREHDYYESFAEWLVAQTDEATEAFATGEAFQRQKWANPDVVGAYKHGATSLYKFNPQLLAAEIKTDSSQGIVAFGQAVAYRLFAHRVYVVMPSTINLEDQSRLEALTLMHGLGFVLFDLNTDNPNYDYKIRSQPRDPEPFYANAFLESIKKTRPEIVDNIL